MKKSLISMLSILTAVGSLSPTVTVPTAHAETTNVANARGEITAEILELLNAIQTARHTIQAYSRVPGANQKLDGQLENLENTVTSLRNLDQRRGSSREVSAKVDQIEAVFARAATEFGLSTVALLPNVQTVWYKIPMKIGALEEAIEDGAGPQNPRPIPNPNPRERMSVEFRGSFNSQPVFFTARSAEEFMATCTSFASTNRLSQIYKIYDGSGKQIVQTTNFLDADGMCGTALLNAEIPSLEAYGKTVITIDSIRMAIYNGLNDSELRSFVQAAVKTQFKQTYKVNVDGADYRSENFFDNKDIEAIIRFNVARNGRIVKKGVIHGEPFDFVGSSNADIQDQCAEFMALTNPQQAYKITVNGTEYRSTSFHTQQTACMTIMAAQ